MKIVIRQIPDKEPQGNIEQQLRSAIQSLSIQHGNMSIERDAQGRLQIELDLPTVSSIPKAKRKAIKKWLYARGLRLESDVRDVTKYEHMVAVVYAKLMGRTFEGDDVTSMTDQEIENLVAGKHDVTED